MVEKTPLYVEDFEKMRPVEGHVRQVVESSWYYRLNYLLGFHAEGRANKLALTPDMLDHLKAVTKKAPYQPDLSRPYVFRQTKRGIMTVDYKGVPLFCFDVPMVKALRDVQDRDPEHYDAVLSHAPKDDIDMLDQKAPGHLQSFNGTRLLEMAYAPIHGIVGLTAFEDIEQGDWLRFCQVLHEACENDMTYGATAIAHRTNTPYISYLNNKGLPKPVQTNMAAKHSVSRLSEGRTVKEVIAAVRKHDPYRRDLPYDEMVAGLQSTLELVGRDFEEIPSSWPGQRRSYQAPLVVDDEHRVRELSKDATQIDLERF